MSDANTARAKGKRGQRRKPEQQKKRKDQALRRRLDTEEAKARAKALQQLPQAERETTPGRPPTYRPAFVEMAKQMCALGATDHELAEAFCVSVKSIWKWTVTFPEFAEALTLGKAAANKRVERAFYSRAVGYSYETQKIMQHEGAPVVVPFVQHVPPDVTAGAKWLASRVGGEWRDRHTVEHTGADGRSLSEEMGVESLVETARWIADRLAAGTDAQAGKLIDVTPAPTNSRGDPDAESK